MCLAAHTLYRSEVLSSGKLYHRYTDDFLNSHTFPLSFDPISMNEHQKNLGILEELLENRRDLVEKYFNKPVFTHDIFMAIQHELDTTEVGKLTSNQPIISTTTYPLKSFESCLSFCQVGLLAELINENHIFTLEITSDEAEAMLCCRIEQPLVINKQSKLVYLFDLLSYEKLICFSWQKVMESSGIFLTSSFEPVKSGVLSSSLTKVRNSDRSDYIRIRNKVEEIVKR